MKRIGIYMFLFILAVHTATAQTGRLFYVDSYHGNYQEIEPFVTYTFMAGDQPVKGEMIELGKDVITIEDDNQVQTTLQLDQIKAIILEKKYGTGTSETLGKYALGSFGTLMATTAILMGSIMVASVPSVGVSVLILGGVMGFGSVTMVDSARKSAKASNLEVLEIDGITHHLMVYK